MSCVPPGLVDPLVSSLASECESSRLKTQSYGAALVAGGVADSAGDYIESIRSETGTIMLILRQMVTLMIRMIMVMIIRNMLIKVRMMLIVMMIMMIKVMTVILMTMIIPMTMSLSEPPWTL